MIKISGEKIRQARREANLTQEQLGKVVGAHQITVNRWEKEKSPPGSRMVSKIASATKKPASFFYGEDDTKQQDVANILNIAMLSLRLDKIEKDLAALKKVIGKNKRKQNV